MDKVVAIFPVQLSPKQIVCGVDWSFFTGSIYEELCHGSSITINSETSDSDLATDHKFSEVVARCFCRNRFGPFTPYSEVLL